LGRLSLPSIALIQVNPSKACRKSLEMTPQNKRLFI
jgi:hypothetical protein